MQVIKFLNISRKSGLAGGVDQANTYTDPGNTAGNRRRMEMEQSGLVASWHAVQVLLRSM
jgi:hypothetical protein